jgi:putative protease
MVELLAPVRDEVSLTAAIDAGADAVYFGLGKLNMRASSRGFTPEELPDIIARAHSRNVRVYITVNTIIYENELAEVDGLLSRIKSAGADAVICWDPAVIHRCRMLEIPIHISTQASVANSEAVKFYESLGVRCLVLARELSLEQIREIRRKTSLKLEVFVHGAMCVSISGRCYLSQFLANRSANRGECHQPCRRRYRLTDIETGDELDAESNYLISPKDLCTLPILDKLIAAGIDIFKIEGRSRPPEYVKAVTAAYREAIDAVAGGTYDKDLVEKLMTDVTKVYNRGFSTGFLFGQPGPQDWADRGDNQAVRKKNYIGKILDYYAKPKVAYARISNPLAVGDVVQIEGPTTGVVEMKIDQLRTDDEGFIAQLKKGLATFPAGSHRLRPNDKIYKIVENT